MYRYTHEGEWMISSSPAWLLQSWNVIKMWTEDNTEQDWIKKKVKSLFEIPSLNPLIQNVQMEKMISLLVFLFWFFFYCTTLVSFRAVWGSYLHSFQN